LKLGWNTVLHLKITVNWLVWHKTAGAGLSGLAVEARVNGEKQWRSGARKELDLRNAET
jgi:hypothetical protein